MELRRRKGGDLNAPGDGNAEKVDANESDAYRAAGASSTSEAADEVVGAAVRGGSLLMLLALLQRASTFVLNVLLQRAMLSATDSSSTRTPADTGRAASALEEYGAAAITLELISSTALFLAREPFRVALARSRVANQTAPGMAGGRVAGDKERGEAYRQRFVNTAWLSAPVGLAFAAVVRLMYPWIIGNQAFVGVEENRQAATLVCIAAAVELMCEPLALIFQHRLLIDVRVRAEAAAVLVLGVARYLLVTWAGMGVLSFGYAQLLHSATLAIAYLFFAARDVARVEGDHQGFERLRGWLPGRPNVSSPDNIGGGTGDWVEQGKLTLVGALAGQSLLKHALTEGDKIVLARATSLGRGCGGGGEGAECSQGGSLYEQGVYAIASGYGSLAARLLFQPLEEAARLMFSKLGSEEGRVKACEEEEARNLRATQGRDPSSGQSIASTGWSGNHGGGGSGDGRRLRERMAALLGMLLKLVLTAGLIFVCFGFHYTETLLRLLLAGRGGGRGRSTAVSEVAHVLSWYCVYVLFLAANGMCEAFACAVAQGRQLTGMGAGLVVSFAAFWALVGPLTGRFGTRGLVMANAAGMACRVVCSAVFIRRFFLQPTAVSGGHGNTTRGDGLVKEKNLWLEVVTGALPHPAVLFTMAVSSAMVNATSPTESDMTTPGGAELSWNVVAAARHVAVGAVCLGLSAAVFERFEKKFVQDLKGLWAARRRSREAGVGSEVTPAAGTGAVVLDSSNVLDSHQKKTD